MRWGIVFALIFLSGCIHDEAHTPGYRLRPGGDVVICGADDCGKQP